jgi:hypothetical protein
MRQRPRTVSLMIPIQCSTVSTHLQVAIAAARAGSSPRGRFRAARSSHPREIERYCCHWQSLVAAGTVTLAALAAFSLRLQVPAARPSAATGSAMVSWRCPGPPGRGPHAQGQQTADLARGHLDRICRREPPGDSEGSGGEWHLASLSRSSSSSLPLPLAVRGAHWQGRIASGLQRARSESASGVQ